MVRLAEQALAFRKQRIIEGHSPEERHVMLVSAEELFEPGLAPLMSFENPFGRPQIFGVEFKVERSAA